MAWMPKEQIDRAFNAWWPGVQELYVEHHQPAVKQGWESGYVLGEDHGFGRGWEAAMAYRDEQEAEIVSAVRKMAQMRADSKQTKKAIKKLLRRGKAGASA